LEQVECRYRRTWERLASPSGLLLGDLAEGDYRCADVPQFVGTAVKHPEYIGLGRSQLDAIHVGHHKSRRQLLLIRFLLNRASQV
jgi:hypothetical protein